MTRENYIAAIRSEMYIASYWITRSISIDNEHRGFVS